jgi:hypothetical protein
MAVNESLFPDLVRTGYQIASPSDAVYNCIAHATGVTDDWWWPDPDGFDYWPPGVIREQTLISFLQAFATVGYISCPDCGCPVKDHNAVNRVSVGGTDRRIAHCGCCGACWKSSPELVELVLAYLKEQNERVP